ncbi:hypothetical protein [Microbacterium luticocti]|uniref:hypothetical protein n=1 Tax=Microbacterium luticocti TaxID=451764 RepID=UPI0003FCD561
MTTIAAARAAAPRHVVEAQPMRYPDVDDTDVMTRRGWLLVQLGFLCPGSAQVLAGNRRLGRFGLGATVLMWVLLIATAVTAALSPSTLASIMTASVPLPWGGRAFVVAFLVALLIIAYAVLWVVLAIDTLRLVRLVKTGSVARFGILLLAASLMVASSATAGTLVSKVDAFSSALGSIFSASGPPVPPSDGYYNILLLGADSGKGRDSMRFDSISVVSVNAETGRVVITGIPRDLEGFPFPKDSPMHKLYPDVHTGQAGAN